MQPSKNMVGWFEIPVQDMERAMKFYETVFDVKMARHNLGNLDMAMFPMVEEGMGSAGSLVKAEGFYKPSTDGALIYFTAHSGDLTNELDRVDKAGGKVLRGKTQISEDYGYMGLFVDTEGNRIAIHSRK